MVSFSCFDLLQLCCNVGIEHKKKVSIENKALTFGFDKLVANFNRESKKKVPFL